MKQFVAIFILLLFCTTSSAQEQILLKSFVKRDTVQLRWVPYNVDVFAAGLKNGYELTRQNLKSGAKEKILIPPFSVTKMNFQDSKNVFISDMVEYIEDFMNSSDADFQKIAFSLLSLSAGTMKEIAQLSNVYFEDLNLAAGDYVYRIKVKDAQYSSSQITVKSGKNDSNPEMTELLGESRIDLKEVYLRWEAKELNLNYSGYHVLKSEDNIHFNILNDVAVMYFTSQYETDKTIVDFVDTAVVEGQTYYYKVLPLNYFADFGEESNTVEVYIQQRLTGYCVIDTVKNLDYNRNITGFYVGEDENQISEFILFKSAKVDSGFTQIESQKTENEFFEFDVTSELLTGDRQFYKVAAISVDGDTAYSFPYYHFSLDQEPPGVPTNLEGVIDSVGIVSLKWIRPKDNDLIGFKVYRSNSLAEEFVEITNKLSLVPTFKDTLSLNTLTTEIYYKVRAIDANYNNGELTEPILLLKPDTIPPVPGVLREYLVKEEGIFLKWHNSPSKDLKIQGLLRSSEFKSDTIVLFGTELDTMLDNSCKLGKKYTYTLIAQDKSGNLSYSKPLNITYEIGYRLAPVLEDPEVDREKKIISLKWEPIEEEIYAIQIYKAKADGKFRLYKSIRENVDNFEDASLSINNEYHYKIKVMYKSGLSSKMSESKSVMY